MMRSSQRLLTVCSTSSTRPSGPLRLECQSPLITRAQGDCRSCDKVMKNPMFCLQWVGCGVCGACDRDVLQRRHCQLVGPRRRGIARVQIRCCSEAGARKQLVPIVPVPDGVQHHWLAHSRPDSHRVSFNSLCHLPIHTLRSARCILFAFAFNYTVTLRCQWLR